MRPEEGEALRLPFAGTVALVTGATVPIDGGQHAGPSPPRLTVIRSGLGPRKGSQAAAPAMPIVLPGL